MYLQKTLNKSNNFNEQNRDTAETWIIITNITLAQLKTTTIN